MVCGDRSGSPVLVNAMVHEQLIMAGGQRSAMNARRKRRANRQMPGGKPTPIGGEVNWPASRTP